jgi:hypothetical protein
VLVVLQLLQPVPPQARTLHVHPQGRNQPSPPKHLPQAPGPMDLGLSMGLRMVRAHPCHSLRNLHDSIHGLQSLSGTTHNLSRPDSTSAVVMAAVDTEADQENVKALYSSMKTTSAQIDVGA